MLPRLRAHATYANVMSTICLFILLGGGAYAASHLARNSVGSAQIKRNAVRTSDVRNASLLAGDFKAGQLPSGPRAYGVVGADGTLDPTRSKGLTDTKITGQPGAYCVRPDASTGIDPAAVRPVVSADLADGSGSVHIAQVSTTSFYPAQCPVTAGWEIYTQNEVAGVFASDNVAFSIVVP